MAVFDWVGSLVAAYFFGKWINVDPILTSWVKFIAAWVGVGILVHYLVGVPTTLNYRLGLSEKPKREPATCPVCSYQSPEAESPTQSS